MRRSLLISLAVVGLTLGAIAWFRASLAEVALRQAVAEAGFPEADFTVSALDLDQAVITAMTLGPDLPRIDRLVARYRPLALLGGEIAEIEVAGAEARLQALIAIAGAAMGQRGEGGDGGPAAALPRIVITDMTLSANDPVFGPALARIDGVLDGAGDAPSLALDARIEAAWASGAATVETRGGAADLRVIGRGSAEMALAPLAPHLSPLLEVPIESGRLAAAFTLDAAPGPLSAAGEGGLSALLLALDGALSLTAAVSDLTAAGVIEGADLTLGASLRAAGGAASLTLDTPIEASADRILWPDLLQPEGDGAAVLRVEGPEAGPLAQLRATEAGLAATLAAELAATAGSGSLRLSADLTGEGADPPSLADAISGAVALDLAQWRAGPALLREGALDLAVAAERSESGVAYALSGPAMLAAEADTGGLSLTGGRIEGALDARLERPDDPAAPLSWRVSAPPGAAVSVERWGLEGAARADAPTRAALGAISASGAGEVFSVEASAEIDPTNWSVETAPGQFSRLRDLGGAAALSLERRGDGFLDGSLALTGARVAAIDLGLGARDITLAAPLDPLKPGAAASLSAEIRDLSRPARFGPALVTLDGGLDGGEDAPIWRASGLARLAQGAVRVPISGRVDLASGALRAAAGPTLLRFGAGGVSAAALSPAYAGDLALDGAASLSARIWRSQKGWVEGAAELDLQGLSIDAPDAAVEGLRGTVALSRLLRPATKTPQTVTADRVILGAPLTDATVTFAIDPLRTGSVLRLDSAIAAIAGGALSAENAAIPLGGGPFDLTVGIDGVDLATLVRDWSIEGLSGEGRLSGALPIAVDARGVAIDGGRVAAEGPGVIRVDFGDARQALAGQGQQVDLLVRALEDFRYTALSVGVSRPADADLSLAVSMAGANPEVLEGYPFQFNINLGGQLEKILAAVRQGQRLGSNLVRSGLGPLAE